jgi:hypothetical protein
MWRASSHIILRERVASLLMWHASCKQLLRYILNNKTESSNEKYEVSGFCLEVVQVFTPPECCAVINIPHHATSQTNKHIHNEQFLVHEQQQKASDQISRHEETA